MHVLIVDTETTGLFTKTHTPYAVQISYAVIDTSSPFFPIVEDYDAIIRISDDTPLPDEVVAIHGISRAISVSKGIPVQRALALLRRSVLKYDVRVVAGHNVEFDLRVLDAECRRHSLSGLFEGASPSPSPSPSPSAPPFNPGARSLFGRVRGASLQGDSWKPWAPAAAAANPVPHQEQEQEQKQEQEQEQKQEQAQAQKQEQEQDRARGTPSMGVFCTAKGSIGVCNLRTPSMYGGYYLKYGKLSEVFCILFSERDKARGVELKVFEKYMHNSRVDVLMCVRVYVWLCYGADVFDAWYGEMLNYADENFVSVDDGHLEPALESALEPALELELELESGATSEATDKVFESRCEAVAPRRSERVRLQRMRGVRCGA
jgi:hypothetical protein